MWLSGSSDVIFFDSHSGSKEKVLFSFPEVLNKGENTSKKEVFDVTSGRLMELLR